MRFKIGWAEICEICVKIFECATGNIRVLARNLQQINHTENAKFKHNSNKLYQNRNSVKMVM